MLDRMDVMLADARKKPAGEPLDLFPKAVGQSHTVGASTVTEPGLTALVRHTMDGQAPIATGMLGDLESAKTADQKTLESFLKTGGGIHKTGTTPETILQP